MQARKIISYPHLGSYTAVFRQLFSRLFPDAEVIPPPPITRRTVELGGRYSPDFVCSPFKHNLGNYIEALGNGANLLFQSGTGCRYGYYGELQEQILRDMGYNFEFACISRADTKPLSLIGRLRGLGCQLSVMELGLAFHLAILSIRAVDSLEYWLRENIGFERVRGSCQALQEYFLERISRVGSLNELDTAVKACKGEITGIRLDLPPSPLRVGVVGELYTIIEPASNFFLERQLANYGVSVSRRMGLWFLMFGRSNKTSLRGSQGYLRYPVGANGVDSVSQTLEYARRGYDGILHIKAFGCIPELNATPALAALSRREGIPILPLSFDTQTGEAGVQTRLESFADIMNMRRGG